MFVENREQRGQAWIDLEGTRPPEPALDIGKETMQQARIQRADEDDADARAPEALEHDGDDDQIEPAISELADGDGRSPADFWARRARDDANGGKIGAAKPLSPLGSERQGLDLRRSWRQFQHEFEPSGSPHPFEVATPPIRG